MARRSALMSGAARTVTLTAPVGGWDARNALADMPEINAVIMDNWLPGTDKVTLRRGSLDWATGLPGAVETLFDYAALSGYGYQFAASGGAIYDVTAPGPVGGPVISGFSNNRWQHVHMGTAGGSFLRAFNGQDTPLLYDGTSWGTTPAISGSGLSPERIVWGNVHQKRLWFGEQSSLDAWYLETNAIAGTASKFPLGGVATLGGYIVAMGTWTRDAGDGTDDVAVFLTSEGQALIYQGTDPGSASDWALIGVFRIGKPIGRRCMIKAGADLVIVTQDGFVSAMAILMLDRSQTDKAAISAQINAAVNAAVRSYGGLFGWQPLIYPRGTLLMFNIPQSSTAAHQYVFNTLTGAPARIKGWNALCWGLKNDEIYFGTADGRVVRADVGTSDNGALIEGDCLPAFSALGAKARRKNVTLVEPIFQSAGNPAAALDLNVDYQVRSPSGVAVLSPVESALWGAAKWGIGKWGSSSQIYRGWRGVTGHGAAVALRVRVKTRSAHPSWIATNFLFTVGSGL